MKGLQTRAWIALAALSVVMGLFIFMPAGTTRFWEGWAYLAIFVVASGSTTAYLLKKDPALLARRLRGGSAAETRSAQKLIMPALSLGVLAILVTAALDRRFGWSDAPRFLVFAGQALVATGMLVIFLTYREN
ncbi:MAG TPA: isoprenylcysteine carboxylmethyltransferase family protein, partial [Planctomycetia bacterium]|nr:isoprenylcysteine carboxylmethyltransferase family protein [Planctomycetia bacterium]